VKYKVSETPEWVQLQKSIDALDGVVAKVGWFEKDVYDNEHKTPVASVALIQEYGAVIAPHHVEKLSSKEKSSIKRFAKKTKYKEKIKGVIVIPPRPFIGPALRKNASNFNEMIIKGSKDVLNGAKTLKKVFRELSAKTKNAIQKEIKYVTSPPLSKYTIAKRLARRKNKKVTKSLTKPLIDTGKMIRSISYKVEDSA
jgi:hypothetical protein